MCCSYPAEPVVMFSTWWVNTLLHWLQRCETVLSVLQSVEVYQQRRRTEEHTVTPLQVLFWEVLGKSSQLIPSEQPYCYSAGYLAAGESDCVSPSERKQRAAGSTWPSALCVPTVCNPHWDHCPSSSSRPHICDIDCVCDYSKSLEHYERYEWRSRFNLHCWLMADGPLWHSDV